MGARAWRHVDVDHHVLLRGNQRPAINDEPVTDLDDMLSQLERRAPGDSVTLTLSRAGQQRKQTVVLAAGE